MGSLSNIIPKEINGWSYTDFDLANSEESSDRIASFLNFDDSLYRVYVKGNVRVGVYIAYWTPGKVSYRWAGAHTPDTCWVVNGWTRIDRKYSIPFQVNEFKLNIIEASFVKSNLEEIFRKITTTNASS